MQLNVDMPQRVQQTAFPAQPSRSWEPGPNAVEDGTRAAPGRLPYSFYSDCECPDDCLRDHENE
jgi:hypothetical protein